MGFVIETTDWLRDRERLSAVRRAVFIDEQKVPEGLEWDTDDSVAVHILATMPDGRAIGCARLLPDGHIGRMAVLPAWRGRGVGRALLCAALSAARAHGFKGVRLSAQTHAAGFYAQAGFSVEGPEYAEAGIPHVAMFKVLD